MPNPNTFPIARLTASALPLIKLFAAVSALLLLNGCAALAVSLAGAGAGAGLAHQMNGTASRTFSEPFSKVDAAVRIASKRMYLLVDEVASMDGGQVTKARVSNLSVSVELEPLSPNLTRVNVVARKDLLRVDAATAQEIVAQIERSLGAVELADANDAANAARSGKIDN
ncbi:DUF3568 family protein, partial [Niveibacterium sp.]|uniref:DUF3568 family protein n=1 Tax=Niveibacterium sp. TaxID=2017444 RepID=UPI0035B1B5C1